MYLVNGLILDINSMIKALLFIIFESIIFKFYVKIIVVKFYLIHKLSFL